MYKKKVFMCTVLAEAFYKSRVELIFEFLGLGYQVILAAPEPDTFTETVFGRNKVKYYKINLDRTGINPIYDFKIIKQLQKVIAIEKPDLSYAFGSSKAAIYTTIAAYTEKVPGNFCMINGLGSIFHGSGLKNKLVRFIMSILFKFSLSKSNGVLFQNTDDLNKFVNNNLVNSNKCIIVNGSGVNLAKFPYTKNVSKDIFLFVGRLLKDKGIYEFVEAARIVKEIYPNAEFWVLGGYDTNPTAVKEREMKRWVDSGLIKYFGRQDKVLSFYQKCTVFVLPSYHEGTPRTNLEAMAVGRPIITTDAPGCRETIIDGVTGFMVPPKDSVQLAHKMIRFITNPELAVEMGNNAYAFVVDKYDVNKVNKTILDFILRTNC